MRNAERTALRMGQAEQITEDATLELPESEEKSFKFKSIFTSDGVKKGIGKIGVRNIVIALAVILIGAAVYVNWQLFGGAKVDVPINPDTEQTGKTDVDSNKTEDYFASAEVSRKQARDEAIEVLQSVVDDKGSLEAAKEQALKDISAMAANIESLIKAKGFEECVTVLSGDKATVVVKSDGLKPNQLSQILEIVYLQAGVLPANVTITEK